MLAFAILGLVVLDELGAYVERIALRFDGKPVA